MELARPKPIVGILRAVFLAVALTLMCSIFAEPAWAAPSDDKRAEAEAAYAQLVEKQTFLDETSNAYGEALLAKEAAEAAVVEAQGRIDQASARIADLQVRLSERATYMYRQGGFSIMGVLFGSNSLSELISNWIYLNIMNQNDATLIQESKDLRAEVQAQKVVLVQQQEAAAAKAAEAQGIMEQAQGVVNEVQAIYDSLSAEAAQLLAEEIAAAEAAAAIPENPSSGANSDDGASDSTSNDNDDDSSHDYHDDYAGRTDPNAVVGRAMEYLGNARYVWGAVSPGAFDCSGFVSYCLSGQYRRLGTTHTFILWPEVSDPRPGDVCVDITHTGIYLGNGQMIHCTSSANNVIITPVWSSMIFVRY